MKQPEHTAIRSAQKTELGVCWRLDPQRNEEGRHRYSRERRAQLARAHRSQDKYKMNWASEIKDHEIQIKKGGLEYNPPPTPHLTLVTELSTFNPLPSLDASSLKPYRT